MANLSLWTAGEILRMRKAMDRQFARLCEDFGSCGPAQQMLSPGELHMTQEGDSIVVRLSLKGAGPAEPEDLDVSLEDDMLTITLSTRREVNGASGTATSRSTSSARLRLPCRVQKDTAEAVYENDMLTITLPRCRAPKATSLTVRKGA